MNYNKALFRRNNSGLPTVWYGEFSNFGYIRIYHGILGKTITIETINTGGRTATADLASRIASKRKEGYLSATEVTDQGIFPVEEVDVIAFLNTYLPHDRQSSTGAMLPMLAKLYDNSNNKLFSKGQIWIAQPKINGLRGEIGAKYNQGDMFKPIRLTFQSREGTYWDSLGNLEDYLLKEINPKLIELMLDHDYLLDGELYIPGETVNNINSYVKNTKIEANKLIQFWCYDIACGEFNQETRLNLLDKHAFMNQIMIQSKDDHLNNKERFIYLGREFCRSHEEALKLRNKYILWGFEGGIFRDPAKPYQYGKRNLTMIKFKETTDGKFRIIKITAEDKRINIPLLTLKNDINDATFDVHITGSFGYQQTILQSKEKYIGRLVLAEYGERSGVNQLPFHVKTVTLLEES